MNQKIAKTEAQLATVKTAEASKTRKLERLENEMQLFQENHNQIKTTLEQKLTETKQKHRSLLWDLATIIFPSSININNISGSDLTEKIKEKAQKIVKENEELKNSLLTLQSESNELKNQIELLEQQKDSCQSEYDSLISFFHKGK